MSENKTKAVYHGSEARRKLLVALKRRPQLIPLLVLIIAFLVYSLNLTEISDTTAKIQGQGMGLSGFCTMLFSMLSLLCFLNAFPYRKRPHIPMLLLMFLLFGVVIYSDIWYVEAVLAAVNRAENPIEITASTIYIAKAYNVLVDHMRVLYAAIALIVLLPIYGRLIRRINTNVEVEDNGTLEAIDISGEE